jgi:two-component sensor histidine kinase
MHPILSSGKRLLLYLASWAPILGLLALVTGESIAVLAPAGLLYAFLCLTPWYVCRARPLHPSKAFSIALTHGVSALAGGGFLLGALVVAAAAIDKPLSSAAPLFGMGVLLYLLSVGTHYAGLAAEASRESERRVAEARTLAREAELRSLRLQLNPHFLFNSLHSISALATLDGARAREMCVRLADFLRGSLALGSRDNIPLREELALARRYLEVEQVRFGSRLRVEEDIDAACENCAVPALLVQPLVENAVKHGIAGLLEGGTIRLTVGLAGATVTVAIENEIDPGTEPRPNLGVGLAHVRRRLEVRFAGAASLQAGPEGNVYRVVLRFPCESPMAVSSRA